jgi:hypothetical protein
VVGATCHSAANERGENAELGGSLVVLEMSFERRRHGLSANRHI